jgi:hypothetical protein
LQSKRKETICCHKKENGTKKATEEAGGQKAALNTNCCKEAHYTSEADTKSQHKSDSFNRFE